MTVADDLRESDERPSTSGLDSWDLDAEPTADPTTDVSEPREERDPRPAVGEMVRPLVATGLAAVGSGLVVGGIFGSWTARLLCAAAAVLGTAYVMPARRSRSSWAAQLGLLPLLFAAAFFSLIGTAGGGPNELPQMLQDAIESGRLFRPPVPFDPGWRPVLVLLFGVLAFGAGMMATAQGRPKLAVGVVVPITLLGLFTQPDDATFVASVFAFLPLLGSVAVLFGDDGARADELGREFEARRAIQGSVGALAIVGALVALNSADFLFPEPVYKPDDRPQKPRAVPLSAARDRVLFEVITDSTLTGPWRIGSLDVYDDEAFQSVPSESRLKPLPADGTVSSLRAGRTPIPVTITVRDLGDTAVLPTLGGVTSLAFPGQRPKLAVDPRYQTVRVPSGRVPKDLVYSLSVPPYATAEELQSATEVDRSQFETELAIPDPPPVVADLLRQAPQNPWLRLDFLRQTLLDRVVTSGQGAPVDVTPDRVAEILAVSVTDGLTTDDSDTASDGGNEASPFEIVASEALLARWAGVPSRIGFGFDGLNLEDGLRTVRPHNSAQWLEVWFEGYGWIPLVGQPNQAKASLEDDPNSRSAPTIEASDEIAARVYVVYEQRDLELIYERVRGLLLIYGPWLLVAALAYGVSPGVAKVVRRRRRRQWAARRGPMAQIGVEYAEFRDMSIDLSVGDDYDTPLEYLQRVQPDREHQELAWLTTRAVYGDMVHGAGPDDVEFARQAAASLRTRLLKGQPLLTRGLALISRASIELPWTTEIPNVRVFRIASFARAGWSGFITRIARTLRAVARTLRTVLLAPLRAVSARLATRTGRTDSRRGDE